MRRSKTKINNPKLKEMPFKVAVWKHITQEIEKKKIFPTKIPRKGEALVNWKNSKLRLIEYFIGN